MSTDIDRLSIDTDPHAVHGRRPEARTPATRGCRWPWRRLAYLLFTRVMSTTRATRTWPDRDRFVLSAGHGSMLLYSALHLSGYDLSLDDLKQLPSVGLAHAGSPRARPRPRHARRRGHDRPARAGLRQRRRHGDGRALPARALRRRGPGPPHLRDLLGRRPHGGHRLRGGVARRQARARPHGLPLRRQLDLARRPDVAELRHRGRHQALRGLRLARRRPSTTSTTSTRSSAAIDAAQEDEERPSLIRVKSIIGWPAPNKQGTQQGARLAARRGRGPRRRRRSWAGTPTRTSSCPTGSTRRSTPTERGAALQREWDRALPRLARRGPRPSWPSSGTLAWSAEPHAGLREALPIVWEKDEVATRTAGQQVHGGLRADLCRRWSAARRT